MSLRIQTNVTPRGLQRSRASTDLGPALAAAGFHATDIHGYPLLAAKGPRHGIARAQTSAEAAVNGPSGWRGLWLGMLQRTDGVWTVEAFGEGAAAELRRLLAPLAAEACVRLELSVSEGGPRFERWMGEG